MSLHRFGFALILVLTPSICFAGRGSAARFAAPEAPDTAEDPATAEASVDGSAAPAEAPAQGDGPGHCYCKASSARNMAGFAMVQKSAKEVIGSEGKKCLADTPCTECSRYGEACCLVNANGSQGTCGSRVVQGNLDFENKRCLCGFKFKNKVELRDKNPACVPTTMHRVRQGMQRRRRGTQAQGGRCIHPMLLDDREKDEASDRIG